jgi:hypothetical protein
MVDPLDYAKMLRYIKANLNKESGKICIKQIFSTDFIREANQHLQYCIDYKKLWFASNIRANGDEFGKALNYPVDTSLIPFEDVSELAEFQDDLIYQTKKQCSLIEVTSTSKGTQSFDLPSHLKRDRTEKRARKDNYTTLMLGTWLAKLYYQLKEEKTPTNNSFTPFFA